MTAKHGQTDPHESAATHHEQAARYHREAAKHFEAGKDPGHWAHKALVAHGHTLQAVKSGKEAREYYAKYDETAANYPQPTIRFPTNVLEIAKAMTTNLQEPQRHAVAADHHEQAARHHKLASRYYVARNYVPAAAESQLAHRHAQQSVFHSHETAKQHITHYMKGLSADETTPPWRTAKA